MFDRLDRCSRPSPYSSGRALASYYNGAGPSLATNRDECRRSEPGIGSDRSRNERAATLPRISVRRVGRAKSARFTRSEEHTSELQSLMRISYAVFCLQKKTYPILDVNNNIVTTYTNRITML